MKVLLHDFRNMLGSLMGNLDYIRYKFDSCIFSSSYDALQELRDEVNELFTRVKDSKVTKEQCAEIMGTYRGRIDFIKSCIHSSVDSEDQELCDCLHDMRIASTQCETIIGEAEAHAVSTKISERPVTVSVASYLNSITEGFKKQFENVNFNVEVQAKPKATIYPSTLKRSIENLLLNSVQAIESEGGEIVIRVNEVELPCEDCDARRIAPGKYCMIEIQDNGSGIPTEVLQNIFRKHISTKAGGSGLGLISVRNGILVHNGHVMIESQEGEYTRVRTYIPSAPPPKKSDIYTKKGFKEKDVDKTG